MKGKDQRAKTEAPEMGFTVKVDGRTFGPYPEKEREKLNYLAHKKGVEIKPVKLCGGSSLSLSLSLSLSRKKKRTKQEHPSLLDGIDFTPVHRTRNQGF